MHSLIGQLAAYQRFGNLSSGNNDGLISQTPVKAISPAEQTGTITPQAVTAPEDTVEISQTGKAFGDLQAIINEVNAAKDGKAAAVALTALKTFVNENTNASFAGDVMGKLGEMADKVLDMLEEDPNAFGSYTRMSLDVHYKQKNVSSDNYYRDKTSLKVSFSFESETTSVHANLGFSESTKVMGNMAKYRSREYADITVTSKGMSIQDNPAIAAFSDILNILSGEDAGSITQPPVTPLPPPADDAAPATDEALPTVATGAGLPIAPQAIDVIKILQEALKAVDNARKSLEDLLEQMREFMEALNGEPQASPVPPVADNQNDAPAPADNQNSPAPVAPTGEGSATA